MSKETTRQEYVSMKRSAQRIRLKTLKDLKRSDNSAREIKSLIQILELAHKTIMLANLRIDMYDTQQ